MKRALLVLLVAAACGGPKHKNTSMVPEGSGVSDNCCCKSSPATSEDGKPVYEPNVNRMECSTKQGECEPDVQCNASEPASSGLGSGDVPPPPSN
jgi:hypothetical protein